MENTCGGFLALLLGDEKLDRLFCASGLQRRFLLSKNAAAIDALCFCRQCGDAEP